MTSPTLTQDEVRWVAAQFARAPSIHNTQPWLLRWDGHRFEVRADRDRQLAIADPDGRELILSCGAAAYGLRLAIEQLGRYCSTRRLPEASDPDLLEVIDVRPSSDVRSSQRMMPAGFRRRHTRRASATPLPLTIAQAVALNEAAMAYGAELRFVTDPGPLHAVLRLTHEAEWRASDDVRVRRETHQWTTTPKNPRRDGVPATAFTSGGPGGSHQIARRDFDLGRGVGRLDLERISTQQVAVLTTIGDRPEDWLRAGEALHALLLVAADQWIFAEINSRVTELPDARVELARQLGTLHRPQLLLQFCAAQAAPVTPRRPVDEFLTVTDAVLPAGSIDGVAIRPLVSTGDAT